MKNSTNTTMCEIPLIGLDGSNPLAFMAALGTLRSLTLAWPERCIKMSWRQLDAAWRPVLHVSDEVSKEDLLDALENFLQNDFEKHPSKIWECVLSCDIEQRRSQSLNCALTSSDKVNWLGGIGINTWADDIDNFDTQVRTTRKDYHIGNIKKIIRSTQKKHICATLFDNWAYLDGLNNQSLHLDPSEDRRHAYQWNEPTKDPSRKKRGNNLGANRLALEAFPIIYTIPIKNGLKTIGFSGRYSTEIRWRWPIWKTPIGLIIIPSLLSLEAIQKKYINYLSLYTQGIVCVYESQRIVIEKTRNFTPARPV